MPLDKLPDLVDYGQRIQIALALRLPPGKQSMAAQHNPIAAGILLGRPLHHHRQLKARPLPRQPHQRVTELAVELLHLHLAVGRGGQRDPPVRMKVVYMRKRQKSVKRRVDRSRHWIAAEGAQRVKVRHLIFPLRALVAPFESQQLLLVERGKPGPLDAPQVAARAFHPQHLHRLAGQWVHFCDLRACVAAGKIRDAQIRAQQVRAIAQQFRFV